MKSPVPILDTLNEWQTFSPGLERVTTVLHALGDPHLSYHHILVGGTNGKGTVSYNLSLKLPGKRGLFLSPHLHDVRERITIAGRWIPDEVWCEAYCLILERAPNPKLSYFEWLLILAVVMFSMEEVDGAVFEIGLGGRWDAANALDPALSVLTNVSLDHMELLGDSIEKIALEKIEIARKGKPFFFPETLNDLASVRRRLTQIGCEPVPVAVGSGFSGNAVLVNAVLEYLGVTGCEALSLLPGRREVLREDPWLLLDGAHNQAGWSELADWLNALVGERINMLVGLSGKRAPSVLIDCLSPVAQTLFVWHFDTEKMIDADAWPTHIPVAAEKDFAALLREPLLVCGSLYMVGKFRSWLQENSAIC